MLKVNTSIDKIQNGGSIENNSNFIIETLLDKYITKYNYYKSVLKVN